MRLLLATALVTLAVLAIPMATADPVPTPDCIAIYQPIVEGPPVTIVLTSGCSARIELCGRSLGEAVGAPNPLDCI